MALVSEGRSRLNPNAPLFIPAAFRQVEDFSPEWWELVTTSPWYHNYWLSQHHEDDGLYSSEHNSTDDIANLLPETFDLDVAGDDFDGLEAQFEEFIRFSKSESDKSDPFPSNGMSEHEGFGTGTDTLIQNMKHLEEKSRKFQVEHAKYGEKPSKNSPRSIQQPR